MTGIALIGCGYVADLYMRGRHIHPGLRIRGVYDRAPERARSFAAYHGLEVYPDRDALLADDRVSIVLNLTNPREHFSVSRACLEGGKHVYSEKPLAMELSDAKALTALAAERGLWISCAPCSLLGESAQTMWKALRDGLVGTPRMVYAEMDDGVVYRMPYRKWVSDSGVQWPYRDEFEVGCTVEHAGYYAAWLPAFFGPVKRMVVWGGEQVPDKVPGEEELDMHSPDVTVACLEFASGVKARLTCSILAPHDHRLLVAGDDGTLSLEDCWRYHDPVRLHKPVKVRRKLFYLPWKRKLPLLKSGFAAPKKGSSASMDWFRGVADLAAAIEEGRAPTLSPEYCLHVAEIVLAIHESLERPGIYEMTTDFPLLDPLPWAR